MLFGLGAIALMVIIIVILWLIKSRKDKDSEIC